MNSIFMFFLSLKDFVKYLSQYKDMKIIFVIVEFIENISITKSKTLQLPKAAQLRQLFRAATVTAP